MAASRVALMALVTNATLALATSFTSLLGSNFGIDFLRQNRGWGAALGNKYIGSTGNYSSSADSPYLPVRRQLIDFPDDAIMGFYFKLVVPYWSLPKVCESPYSSKPHFSLS